MAEKLKDREPWSPRIDSMPLFINSADYERRLVEGRGPPEIEETVSPAVAGRYPD